MNTKNAATPTDGDALAFSLAEQPVDRYMKAATVAADKSLVKEVRSAARADFMRLFGQRCRQARELLPMEIGDAAAQIGVHRNTVWNIERGDSLPDVFDLQVMARIYKTTPAWLLAGNGLGIKSATSVEKSVRAVHAGSFVYVPEFDIHASAGNGFFNQVESVVAMRPFDEAYIRGELGIQHDELVLTKVIGRSMEPDLRSRDTTLIDLKDREVLTEGIHILRLDGALLVKKVQRLPGRVLRVSSSNPSFEPFEIQGTDDADRDFEVLGRVRWAGVTFS